MRSQLLKSTMVKRRITERTLAEAMHKSPTTICHKVRGDVDWTVTEVRQLITILNLDLLEMFDIFFRD